MSASTFSESSCQRALLVNADAGRLTQVIANLLTNSAKYTPARGNVHVLASEHEGVMTLRVRDDGRGIDPTLLPHVFERFVQGNHSTAGSSAGPGLGLGLAIARKLVALHGGTLEADSAGEGPVPRSCSNCR